MNVAHEASRLYVVAEPILDAADRAWVDEVRLRHDPQAHLIGPHFTLVFGTTAVTTEQLCQRAADVARHAAPFACTLVRAIVHHQHATDAYVFLMPDAGAYELPVLHEALRLHGPGDPSFVPHLTVGRFTEQAAAMALADRLNGAGRALHGRVTELRILTVANGEALTLATVPLGDPRKNRSESIAPIA